MIRVIVASIAIILVASASYATATKQLHSRHRHIVDVASVEEPRAQKAESSSCRPTSWKSVTPDIVQRAQDLLKQYKVTSDQLTKLGPASGTDVSVKIGWRTAYEGSWPEVRQALQDMLQRRLAGIACSLQALGVDVGTSAKL